MFKNMIAAALFMLLVCGTCGACVNENFDKHYNACLEFQKLHPGFNLVIVSDNGAFTENVDIYCYKMLDSETIKICEPLYEEQYNEPLDMFFNDWYCHFYFNGEIPAGNYNGLHDNTFEALNIL
jgi:hypothetical protein